MSSPSQLAGAFRMGRADAPSAQIGVGTDDSGAVALVCDDTLRPSARSDRTEPRDANRCHHVGELGAVVDVSAGEEKHEWKAASPVGGQVERGGQSIARERPSACPP